jgi:hypothetical protein
MIKVTRRETTQNERYVYSASRAARILGVKEVEFVYVCGNGKVLVGLFNDSIYLSEQDFKVSYAKERQERAKGLQVTKMVKDDHSYTVRNENKVYEVKCKADSITCSCPDHAHSIEVFGSEKVACKHVYAVLNELGYTSLASYLRGNIFQIAL